MVFGLEEVRHVGVLFGPDLLGLLGRHVVLGLAYDWLVVCIEKADLRHRDTSVGLD